MKLSSDEILEKCRRILKGALKAPRDEQVAEMQNRGLIDAQGQVLMKDTNGANGKSHSDRPAR